MGQAYGANGITDRGSIAGPEERRSVRRQRATAGEARASEVAEATALPGSRWLSVRDIADDLGVSMSTAYKWSARGEPDFPRSIRLRNGDLRVRRDWYETWLENLEDRAGHPITAAT